MISIIVPVYKVEKYLDGCVKSLISQAFTDIEIILVDDGSPDSCPAMCDEWARKDKRINVIHKKNGGLSSARNAGIKEAKGEYICFVDSDDLISSDYCSTLFDLLDGTDYDYSVGSVYRFNDGEFTEPTNKSDKTIPVTNIELLNMQICRKSEFGVWNKLYRREIFDKLSFADGKINEDVIWSADIAAYCKNGAIITDKIIYYYRMRKGGIVSQQAAKGSVDRIYAGRHLVENSEKYFPKLKEKALKYALNYPWSFMDKIVVNHSYSQNKEYIQTLYDFVKHHKEDIKKSELFSKNIKHRILLFAKSPILFYINGYIRLMRLYLFKIVKKNPYKNGHGI